MAFLAYDPNLDPNKKLQDQNGPQNISGESGSFDSEPPGAQASQGKQKSSGQYANIQAYLGANKEQAANMGGQITQNVEQKSQQAQGDISKLSAEKPNVTAVDPNQYLANPSADKKDEYTQLKQTGGYTGPEDVTKTQNYQSAYGSVNEADNLVKAAGTEEGRMTLLQDQFKRPNYSRGLQTLDQALLQNDPTSKQKFADLSQKYSGISSLFDSTANEVGNAINQSKQVALQNKQNFQDAETKSWNDLLNPIKDRVNKMNQENPALISRITQDTTDNILNDETLQRLGLKEGQDIYDLNLGNYVTPNQSQVGVNNAATAEERARYLALESLINDPTRTEISADGQAINPVTFKKDAFDKDLSAKKAEYENAYATQRGTILNPNYLDNPNAAGGYTAMIPGALTDRRDINNATAQELETFWIPIFRQAAGYGGGAGLLYNNQAGAIQKSLDDWKAKYQPNRQIKKG